MKDFSALFVDRPILAAVLSTLISRRRNRVPTATLTIMH
jgi:hypothetical protein